MSEWIAIDQWKDCGRLARPGIVFEMRNTAGQSLLTPCVQPLPPMPYGWTSPPIEFRTVAEPKPRRSEPLPEPKG
jgi:hypothetical protein